MELRKKIEAETPCIEDSPAPQFVTSSIVEREEVLYDADGREVSSQIVSLPIQKEIPDSEFENRGLKACLFTVENQKAAGIDLFSKKPLTAPFYRQSLEDKGNVIDTLNETDFEQIIDDND